MNRSHGQRAVAPLVTVADCQGKAYVIRDLSRLMITYITQHGQESEFGSVFEVIKGNAECILRLFDRIEFIPGIDDPEPVKIGESICA